MRVFSNCELMRVIMPNEDMKARRDKTYGTRRKPDLFLRRKANGERLQEQRGAAHAQRT